MDSRLRVACYCSLLGIQLHVHSTRHESWYEGTISAEILERCSVWQSRRFQCCLYEACFEEPHSSGSRRGCSPRSAVKVSQLASEFWVKDENESNFFSWHDRERQTKIIHRNWNAEYDIIESTFCGSSQRGFTIWCCSTILVWSSYSLSFASTCSWVLVFAHERNRK